MEKEIIDVYAIKLTFYDGTNHTICVESTDGHAAILNVISRKEYKGKIRRAESRRIKEKE